MAKMNAPRPPSVTRTLTHEGSSAYRAPALRELALTGASTFLGEDTFYEPGDARVARLRTLLAEAMRIDWRNTQAVIANLRQRYQIRTAALYLAATYAESGGPHARWLIDQVCQRPDEPAEVVAYWQRLRNGGTLSLPWAVRRGLADAVTRLYTERNVLRYGQNRRAGVSMADVIELTHPRPQDEAQSALWRYVLDEAHHGDGRPNGWLPGLRLSERLGQMPEAERRSMLSDPVRLHLAGYGTWERLSGWLPGGMDAEAWEAVIPNMGVMALLRNLRNFDEAGISKTAQVLVETKLSSATEVARSRIFPYRVLPAYLSAPSDRWRNVLGETLELAARNVPSWDRTLFLVDMSGSMAAPMSARSQVRRVDVASLMAALAVTHSTNSDVVGFGQTHRQVAVPKGFSALRLSSLLIAMHETGEVGHSTYGHTAMAARFAPSQHARAVVFTDEQMHDSPMLVSHVPKIVYFNLAGYAPLADVGRGRVHVGGFSDAAFMAAADLL